MRTFLIALASALLLAFIVIQLNVLLFADDQLTTQHHLSLLVLTVIALLANGLFKCVLERLLHQRMEIHHALQMV